MRLEFLFHEVWLVDFEFSAPPSNVPEVRCMVARELFSKKEIRLWQDELHALSAAPFDIGERSLFVAYYASAECSCFLSLGWALPVNVLDLYIEFRLLTCGLPQGGHGLLAALQYFGLSSIEAAEKEEMRDLAIRGGEYTALEKQALFEYCASDVHALERLLPFFTADLDMPRALWRGRYMPCCAIIEYYGIPLDSTMLQRLQQHREKLHLLLIAETSGASNIYENGTFRLDKFQNWLYERGISWPRHASGTLDLSDATFRWMAAINPEIRPVHELRGTLAQLRKNALSIGKDGRSRCLLSPYASKTSRNQPSNSKFIFGMPGWMRGLIKPAEGYAVAYIDYEQQEFGIAAALSGDLRMQNAYRSGDPYLEFAKQAGAVPPDATKETHKAVRDTFKACALAVQYGMGAEALAGQIKQPAAAARELLRLHRQTYSRFWTWIDDAANYASLQGRIHTVFGWTMRLTKDTKALTIGNYPMQANGAEILRLACNIGLEKGIKICAPVHDAVLIEAPISEVETAIADMRSAMAESSRIVLGGFELRTGVDRFDYPSRFMPEKGASMWDRVMKLLEALEGV